MKKYIAIIAQKLNHDPKISPTMHGARVEFEIFDPTGRLVPELLALVEHQLQLTIEVHDADGN